MIIEKCTKLYRGIQDHKKRERLPEPKTFILIILVLKSREIVEAYKNVKDYLILILHLKRWFKKGITEMKVRA